MEPTWYGQVPVLGAAVNMTDIYAELWKLHEQCRYDQDQQCTLLPDGTRAGTCTNSARLLQQRLGLGIVMGYFHADNPSAVIGKDEGGHDFLVTPDHIIDFWAADTYGHPSVLHRIKDYATVRELYGHPDTWKIVIADIIHIPQSYYRPPQPVCPAYAL